jgi:glycosyltransferase involved in cell wall biosynthesis
MQILVDAIATPPAGAGLTRIVELAVASQHRPDIEYVIVARPDVAPLITAKAPATRLIVPPRWSVSVPPRMLWEQIVLPRRGGLAPDLVFSPFNVLPLRGWSTSPAFAVLISNLAPYSDLMRNLCPKRRLPREIALKRLTDASIAASDLVLLESHHAVDLIGEALRNKAIVIPHAPLVLPKAPVPPLIERENSEYFLIVAELHTHKGVEVAIRALSRLPQQGSHRLVICGTPRDRRYQSKLTELSTALGISRSVEFIGPQPHEKVIDLMAGSKACIACSLFENLSRIPGEAMLAGTPVLASDIPAYRESCGAAALYFPPDDDAALANLMQAVTTDEMLAEKLVADGKQQLASASAGQVKAPDQQMLDSLEHLADRHRA